MNWNSILSGLQTLTNSVENADPIIQKKNLGFSLNSPLYTLDKQLEKFPHDQKIGHLNTVSIPKHYDELKPIMINFRFLPLLKPISEQILLTLCITLKDITFLAPIEKRAL